MFGRVMFGEVISPIVDTLVPIYPELLLCNSIFHPVKLHVKCFGSFRFYCIVEETISCTVVYFKRCGSLWIADFNNSWSNRYGYFTIGMYRATSASAADDITFRSVTHSVSTGPLGVGVGICVVFLICC